MLLPPVHLAGKIPSSSTSNLGSPAVSPPSTMEIRAKRRLPKPPAKPPPTREADAPILDVEDFAAEDSKSIRDSLLRWYDRNRRDLPWRRSSTKQHRATAAEEEENRAYAVWVSEVMLQQTQVAVVVSYYDRWMARWPTIRQLARASQEEINEMWAGLGYYRRARFLLEGAKSIAQEGKFPRTAANLRELRGIGEYTAGAIASIAFNEAVPAVDGNVVRVISRLKAISTNPKETATVKGFWKLAGQLVDPCRPGDFNQALMELGATLCSKSKPSCAICPVSNQCRAFVLSKSDEKFKVTDYPAKVVKAKPRKDFAAVCVVEISRVDEEHLFLLVKRPEEGLLAGFWEFPLVILDEENFCQTTRRRTMDKYLKKLFKLDARSNCNVILREDVGELVHIFSHIRLSMYVELMILSPKGGLNLSDFEKKQIAVTWKCVNGSSIKSMGLTSGVRKVYNMIQDFKQKQLPKHPKRARGRRKD